MATQDVSPPSTTPEVRNTERAIRVLALLAGARETKDRTRALISSHQRNIDLLPSRHNSYIILSRIRNIRNSHETESRYSSTEVLSAPPVYGRLTMKTTCPTI